MSKYSLNWKDLRKKRWGLGDFIIIALLTAAVIASFLI